MITESQAKALANVLHEIRPRWGIQSMMTMLQKQAQHPARFVDIAVAAVTAARDPVAETPGIIFIDTRFWPEEAKTRLPKPPPCADHPEQEAFTCRCCHADVLAGDRPQTHIGKHWAPATAGASLIQEETS